MSVSGDKFLLWLDRYLSALGYDVAFDISDDEQSVSVIIEQPGLFEAHFSLSMWPLEDSKLDPQFIAQEMVYDVMRRTIGQRIEQTHEDEDIADVINEMLEEKEWGDD